MSDSDENYDDENENYDDNDDDFDNDNDYNDNDDYLDDYDEDLEDVDVEDDTNEGNDNDDGSVDRMKALLSSYYGTDKKSFNENDINNVDSVAFDCDNYLIENINTCKIQNLITIDKQYAKELSSYDNDMQSLVYENYTKFISATDTIKNMKVFIILNRHILMRWKLR